MWALYPKINAQWVLSEGSKMDSFIFNSMGVFEMFEVSDKIRSIVCFDSS